jgi:bifunctional non-homologous end joining protein LigD
MMDDYANRQAARDREYADYYRSPEYLRWVDGLSPAERRRLEAEGLLAPMIDRSGSTLRDEDASLSNMAAEEADVPTQVDLAEDTSDSEKSEPAESSHDERLWDVLRRLLGELLNPIGQVGFRGFPRDQPMTTRTKKAEVEVEGRTIVLSNLDKVFYPKVGFSKAQVIDYYIRVAPVLLPHLKNRPLTLKRYPDGVEGPFFYEKQCPPHRPAWVKTLKTPRRNKAEDIDYCVIDGLPALVWVANLADLELHTFLHRTTSETRPSAVVFDLDPGPPANMLSCCRVALWLREMLADLKLQALAKTSGSKGLQIYIPLNVPVSYKQTAEFSHRIAHRMTIEHPDFVIPDMSKILREGKVFIDWSQNNSHKTTVCVYSLRANDRPSVSTPVTWEEVENAWKTKTALGFNSENVLKRVEKHGDLFEPVLTFRQKLPNTNP